MHGAGGGAPNGNKNALKHGLYTAEAVDERRMVAALTRQARELVETVQD
jgi:glucans biosynthesis protein